MVSVKQYLDPLLIIPEIETDSRTKAISLLIDKIYKSYPRYDEVIKSDELLKAMLEREHIQTTGIGSMIAFPHVRLEKWTGFVMAFGFSRRGINFHSIDKKPVHFVCLMISSTNEPYMILQTMASMIRFLKASDVLKKYVEGQLTADEIITSILNSDIYTSKLLLASDIARPVRGGVYLNDSIEKATRIMHLQKLDSLAVLDKSDRFQGEISCLDIFHFGMPDFFNQLNSVSFVRHIDPFQKYFRIRKNLLVEHLFDRKVLPINKETTLIEIVFEMAVKNRMRLFVVEEEMKLIGEIDRFSIIDKILLE